MQEQQQKLIKFVDFFRRAKLPANASINPSHIPNKRSLLKTKQVLDWSKCTAINNTNKHNDITINIAAQIFFMIRFYSIISSDKNICKSNLLVLKKKYIYF